MSKEGNTCTPYSASGCRGCPNRIRLSATRPPLAAFNFRNLPHLRSIYSSRAPQPVASMTSIAPRMRPLMTVTPLYLPVLDPASTDDCAPRLGTSSVRGLPPVSPRSMPTVWLDHIFLCGPTSADDDLGAADPASATRLPGLRRDILSQHPADLH